MQNLSLIGIKVATVRLIRKSPGSSFLIHFYLFICGAVSGMCAFFTSKVPSSRLERHVGFPTLFKKIYQYYFLRILCHAYLELLKGYNICYCKHHNKLVKQPIYRFTCDL